MGVPKSGRATAVGMTIETVFGQAPITLATGSNYNIGIAGTNPERFWKINASKGFTLKPTIKPQDKEIDGDFDVHRILLLDKMYDGDFAFLVDPENLYYPLLALLGVDAQTTLHAADTSHSPAAFAHAFQPNKNRGYVPSLTIEEIFGDHVYGRVETGCVVQKIDFTFGEDITATMSLYAAHQVPNNYPLAGVRTNFDYGSAMNTIPPQLGGDGTKTWNATPTPTYVDVSEPTDGNGPLVFAAITFGSQGGQFASNFLTVDGTGIPVDIVRGNTLSIQRVISRVPVAGTDYDVATFIAHEWTVSGKMDLLFLDNTIPLAVMRKATCGLNFKVVGPPIGTSGYNYQFEVYIPNFNFLEGNLEIPASEMMTGGNFYAKQDPIAGYSVLLTLQNTVTNASLAGTAGSSPGGLGGWNTSP